MPAVAALDHAPEWQRIYADEYAVVHQRRLTVQQQSFGNRP
jgi:hypothetical protein